MNERKRMSGAFAVLLMMMMGCQTVGSQAPTEVREAEKAVDQVKRADVEDYMPSAMEAAQRKLDQSAALLDDAADYQDKGLTDQAKSSQKEAIRLAKEAKAIADGGTELVANMHAYDSNSVQYTSAEDRAARAEKKLNRLKEKYAKLEGKYGELSEMEVPSTYLSGKPVAFFGTGSTTLAAKYRTDIQELATVLKNNKKFSVTLEGYADPRGNPAKNKTLAENRLKVVSDELKAQGIGEDRIKLVALGATNDQQMAQTTRPGELQLDRKVVARIETDVAH